MRAFIDESGNTNLNTSSDGSSTYFIISAVIINDKLIDKSIKLSERIREDNFQSGVIKSSKVGNNYKRRAKIITQLNKIPFKLYALVVDKNEIKLDSGLRFKISFLKFLNGKVYNTLFNGIHDVYIEADKHGSSEFMESFDRYISSNHKPDLFSNSDFNFVNDEDSVLVQVADFISGTLSKIYENKYDENLYKCFQELIKEKLIEINEWPRKLRINTAPRPDNSEQDILVSSYCLEQAEAFIENSDQINEEFTRHQVCVLKYLMFKSTFYDDNEYSYKDEIIKHLETRNFNNISDEHFKTEIIAKLRDKNVIIASSNKGYKIPTKTEDLDKFVEKVNSNVLPYLKRLSATKTLMSMGVPELVLIDNNKFPDLNKLINSLKLPDKLSN